MDVVRIQNWSELDRKMRYMVDFDLSYVVCGSESTESSAAGGERQSIRRDGVQEQMAESVCYCQWYIASVVISEVLLQPSSMVGGRCNCSRDFTDTTQGSRSSSKS